MSRQHTLLLRLAGPMQSWGFRSRFDNRDTALEPTRSGVIGLLCAALGRERDHDLSRFASLKMGVRVDAPGRIMVDYQTAQEVLRAGGGIAPTTQSWRYYLSDARFLVGLSGDDLQWLRELDGALRKPIYPMFLGRKSYVPSLPIALPQSGVRENTKLEDALKNESWRPTKREKQIFERDQRRGLKVRLSLLIETSEMGKGTSSNDVPQNFAIRRFSVRNIKRLPPVELSEELCQEDELCLSTYRV